MSINFKKGQNKGKDRVHNIIDNRGLFDWFVCLGGRLIWLFWPKARARNILTFMKFKIQNNVRMVSVLDANWTNKFSLSWGTLRLRSCYNNKVVLHNNWLKILASLVMSFSLFQIMNLDLSSWYIGLSKQFFQFLPNRSLGKWPV